MMNYSCRFLFALVLVGIVSTSGSALARGMRESSQSAPSDPDPTLFDSLRREAFDAFYNLDYDTSGKLFKRIVELLPEHPAGYLYLATQTWVGELHRARRLQTDIYSSSSFYSQSEEKVDPEIDRQFRDDVQKAIEKAQARLQKNDRDVEARYFLGAAYAVLAGYEGSVTREFLAGLKDGSRAVSEHRKVIQQDPNFADAYLTIGLYDYIVGSLPVWVKMIAVLGGFHGSRERGIEELQRVVDQGKYVSDDARVVLIAIYAREGQNQKALDLVHQLANRYPRNHLFPVEAASLLVKMGRKQEGFAAFEAMLQHKQFQAIYDMIHFQYANTLSANGYNVAALYHYRSITTTPEAGSQLVTLAHLRIGRLLDLKAEREAAVAEYKTVLSRDNVFDSHEQAQQYIRKPFTGAER
jgi:tetratricopeptide (TPR) repeat protein